MQRETLASTPQRLSLAFVSWPPSHRMCSPTLPRLQKSESWIDRCPADWLTWSLLAQPVA
jgi:hypothetical protein